MYVTYVCMSHTVLRKWLFEDKLNNLLISKLIDNNRTFAYEMVDLSLIRK